MKNQSNMSQGALLSAVPTLIPTILLFVAALYCSQAQIVFPPSESDWDRNRSEREDPRPLVLGYLASRPTIDGQISLNEWAGATTYEVWAQSTLFGVLYMGVFDGFVYAANNWLVNTNPDPLMGGGNAWRVGTATGHGPENSGSGTWYEIYVQEGSPDIVQARAALAEGLLQYATFTNGSFFCFSAGSFFNGTNWQYELRVGGHRPDGDCGPGPGPGPLPPCWHWEWRQLDPRDGRWEPVFDGSIQIPEPASFCLLALGGLALLWRRRS